MWDEIPINFVVKKPFNFYAAASGHGDYSATKPGRYSENAISAIYNTGKKSLLYMTSILSWCQAQYHKHNLVNLY